MPVYMLHSRTEDAGRMRAEDALTQAEPINSIFVYYVKLHTPVDYRILPSHLISAIQCNTTLSQSCRLASPQ